MNEEPTLLECVNRLNRMCLFPERFPQLTAEQIGQLRDARETIDRAIENVSGILWNCPEQNMEPARHDAGQLKGVIIMNVVAYGGGTNSTAMIIGMYHKHIPVDLILFADPGGEQPHTYAYLPIMNDWLARHGLPEIQTVFYRDKNGNRLTLEQECLRSGSLPAIAYGYKKCSLKHKVGPQEKFCNNYPPCREAWARGEKVFKYIGYDVGEPQRREKAKEFDEADQKYTKVYALMDWGWTREDCVSAIQQEGLPLPGKSSCFFCPSMKKKEIRTLFHQHPDLYERAIAIEDGARPNLTSVKGLGRNWAWRDFVEADKNQTAMCWMFPEDDLPCNCHDGG